MFTDARSKTLVLVAHCVMNQNSVSNGTAVCAGVIREVMEFLCASRVGIVQMPCPELLCLGLGRGCDDGSALPVIEENTRIRGLMSRRDARNRMRHLVRQVVSQVSEYRAHGFHVAGIIGMNRSPSCGVDTTSKENQEVAGEGIFIETIRQELEQRGIHLDFRGIKASEPGKALEAIRHLLRSAPVR